MTSPMEAPAQKEPLYSFHHPRQLFLVNGKFETEAFHVFPRSPWELGLFQRKSAWGLLGLAEWLDRWTVFE